MIESDRRLKEFARLLEIMDLLREKCPWDMKQTNESLRKLTIEETYELADAILSNDDNEIKGELGDLMLHIVFYARLGKEKGKFDIADGSFSRFDFAGTLLRWHFARRTRSDQPQVKTIVTTRK